VISAKKKHNHSTNGLKKCCAIDVIEYVELAHKKRRPGLRLNIRRKRQELIAVSIDKEWASDLY